MSKAIFIKQLGSLGPLTPILHPGREVEEGGGLGVVAPVSRRWGNHSVLVTSVFAQCALLTKISSFQPEIPGFDPRIIGIES